MRVFGERCCVIVWRRCGATVCGTRTPLTAVSNGSRFIMSVLIGFRYYDEHYKSPQFNYEVVDDGKIPPICGDNGKFLEQKIHRQFNGCDLTFGRFTFESARPRQAPCGNNYISIIERGPACGCFLSCRLPLCVVCRVVIVNYSMDSSSFVSFVYSFVFPFLLFCFLFFRRCEAMYIIHGYLFAGQT